MLMALNRCITWCDFPVQSPKSSRAESESAHLVHSGTEIIHRILDQPLWLGHILHGYLGEWLVEDRKKGAVLR